MFDFSQLGFYKILFMAQLLLAETLFTFRMKKRSRFHLRIIIGYAVCMLAAVFFPVPVYNSVYTSFMFFCLLGISLIALKLIYDESWLNIGFCACAAYTVEHLSYGIFDFFTVATGANSIAAFINGGGTVSWEMYGSGMLIFILGLENVASGIILAVYLCFYFGCYSLVYCCMYMFFAKRLGDEKIKLTRRFLFVFAIFIIITDIILSSVITYRSYDVYDQVYYVVSILYNILCCIVAIVLQFLMLKSNLLKEELGVVSYLLEANEKQYELSKATVELINEKCHDLKHQIIAWGSAQGAAKEAIDEAAQAISIYDVGIETGNKALDIILTEKSMQCKRDGVAFTCLADGKKLSFMKGSDLYSLFGNAIDNAVESVKKIDESDGKVITLNIREVGKMLSVTIMNRFNGVVNFEDGLPVTTKADNGWHGFGTKSMRRIVEKYGGDITMSAENNVFTVNMWLPLPDEAPTAEPRVITQNS